MSVRQSLTVVVERDRPAFGAFAGEPCECGWANEEVALSDAEIDFVPVSHFGSWLRLGRRAH